MRAPAVFAQCVSVREPTHTEWQRGELSWVATDVDRQVEGVVVIDIMNAVASQNWWPRVKTSDLIAGVRK